MSTATSKSWSVDFPWQYSYTLVNAKELKIRVQLGCCSLLKNLQKLVWSCWTIPFVNRCNIRTPSLIRKMLFSKDMKYNLVKGATIAISTSHESTSSFLSTLPNQVMHLFYHLLISSFIIAKFVGCEAISGFRWYLYSLLYGSCWTNHYHWYSAKS